MAVENVKPLRFITSASLKEIYDEDIEGFDAVVMQPTLLKLSDENNAVFGTERFYNYIFNNVPAIPTHMHEVTGTEGFIDAVKQTATNLLQTIKDFFKWLWSFFSAKENRLSDKLTNIDHRLKDKGVKTKDVRYPNDTAYVYPRAGKPGNDLSWVNDTNKNIAKGIRNVTLYGTDLTTYLKSLAKQVQGENHLQTLVRSKNEFDRTVKTLFKIGGDAKATFIIPNDCYFPHLLLKYSPMANDRRLFLNATFLPTVTTVEQIHKDAVANLKLLKELTLGLQKVEDVLLDTIQKVIHTPGKMDNAVGREINLTVRTAMNNIRSFESILYKALGTVVGICSAATA